MEAHIQLDMPAHVYHGDPCPLPSLSSGLLRTILSESPMHAWFAHPRLGRPKDEAEKQPSSVMQIGSAIHKLVLGRGEEIAVLPFDDFKKTAAKEARDEALAARKIVLLPDDYARAKAASLPLSEAVEDSLGMKIADCLTEAVVTWREGRHWRRIMVDLLTPDYLRAVDLKSSGMSVAPSAAARTIYGSGYHIQAAFYLRGLDALHPAGAGKRQWDFAFVENDAPFSCSPLIRLSQAGYEVAHHEVQKGVEIWDDCLDAGEWPGHYSPEPYEAEPPAWMVARYENDFDHAHIVRTED